MGDHRVGTRSPVQATRLGLSSEREVLILDADFASCNSLKTLVRRRGWTPLVMDPGDPEAATLHPDLALVDICPNGTVAHLSILRTLRQHNPNVRIAALTQYPSMTIASYAVRAGADCCLLKPVADAEVDNFLGGVAPRREDHSCSTELPSLGTIEWEYINRVMVFHRGNISAAARTLGIRRSTLQRKLKKIPPLR